MGNNLMEGKDKQAKMRQSYSKQTTKANLLATDSKCAYAKRSPTGQRDLSQLTMIIDDLILVHQRNKIGSRPFNKLL